MKTMLVIGVDIVEPEKRLHLRSDLGERRCFALLIILNGSKRRYCKILRTLLLPLYRLILAPTVSSNILKS